MLKVAHVAGARYFDAWNGQPLTARIEGDDAILSIDMEKRGFGAVLAVHADSAIDAGELDRVPGAMRKHDKPLQACSATWTSLPQRLVEIAPTAKAASAPEGMLAIPGR